MTNGRQTLTDSYYNSFDTKAKHLLSVTDTVLTPVASTYCRLLIIVLTPRPNTYCQLRRTFDTK